ncbi:iron complex outermembrane receptor protein [Catalinimonas alkaloidigena]|uniref:TonB-dependent receptor n=1 Tax=Catalinimonas alkaloidigena TaxID=1075417 RepID=UPI0024058DBF|nr:TonB-dependent receptor [Catalinimonas alkaloidigena]MDF9794772.1 iron complex outermembrane receptor protein [Catalinimonas alkaloidigena]
MRVFLLQILAALILPVGAWAQVTVSGKVTDAQTNEALAGANVTIAGTTQGTVTNSEGKYSLQVNQTPATLKVSFVGFDSKAVRISAETGSVTKNFSLPAARSLEEVMIKAIRADQKIPVTQKTITRQEIEEVYVGQDALFVLERKTPSILAYSESGTNLSNYGQMRLRGIDQTRINITLNGVPLNDMIDQGVFFSNFTDFGNSIESVQVQRGVGTSTNGTASYAGSINFESVNLRDSVASAEVQLLGGSFDTYRASGEVKTGLLNDKFAFYTRFTRTTSEGYRYHSGTDSYSFFFSGGYFGEKDMVKITGFTGRTKNDLAYLPVALPDIEADPRTNYVSENDTDDFGQHLVQLEYTRFLGQNTSLVSSVYYGGAGGDFPAGFPDEEGNFMQINYPLFNDHYGFMSYLNHTSDNGQWEINGGLHAYTFQRENIEAIIPNYAEPYYQDESRKDELSLFAKASYELGNLILFGDLQFRTVQLDMTADETFLGQEAAIPTRSWTFFNPKVGLTYELNSYMNLYASYGRSGREPTRTDILGSTQINTFNLEDAQNPDAVQAEYVNDFEGGVRMSNSQLSGQANVFYMQFENEIAPIGEAIPEGFIQLRKNMPSSYRRGVEVDWEYRPVTQFTFSGDVTYMQSQIDEYAPEGADQVYTNVAPIISPEWIVNASLEYRPINWLTVAVSPRYVSESYLEPTNQEDLVLPEFFLLDTRATLSFGKHTLSLQLNNLLDKEYYSYGQPVSYNGQLVPGYFVQPPRNFYAILRLRF